MRTNPYTKQYLDFLDKFGDEINQRSDQPLDKLRSFIGMKTSGSSVGIDLLFAIVLMKAPEEILIGITSRPKREVRLLIKVSDVASFGFIWAYPQGKDKIDDQRAREALLSKDRICALRVPGCIKAAEELIKTCKVERIK